MMLNSFYRRLFVVISEVLLQTSSVSFLFCYCMLTTLAALKCAHIFKNKQEKSKPKTNLLYILITTGALSGQASLVTR